MRALFYAGRQHDALIAFSRARYDVRGGARPRSPGEPRRARAPDPRSIVGAGHSTRRPRDSERFDSARDLDASARTAQRNDRTHRRDRSHRAVVGTAARLVTLVGLGGIGKTTTALAVGHRLLATGQAVAFADLAAAVESDGGDRAAVRGGVDQTGTDAATSLAEADPELVLIADNGEQIADFPSAIATLLSTTSRLKLIVTSRVALRIRAEHVMPIRPLETSSDAGAGDAGLLFVDRARRLRADIDLAGDDDAIVEICELAGGIPLAIEVAAGRLGHLTPLALLDRLRRQSVALLDAHGAVDLPDRQQSLRTVLDATSTLLTDGGAALAKGVCAVKGSISLDLIERTFGDQPDLIDHLDELVDASLITVPIMPAATGCRSPWPSTSPATTRPSTATASGSCGPCSRSPSRSCPRSTSVAGGRRASCSTTQPQ